MAVIRVNKTADYTVMSNTHFKDNEISLKAKGLLSLMLSLPDNWDYSINGLVTLSKDGRDSVMNTLTELEDFGYLSRTQITNEKGQFAGYQYDIFENPQQGNSNSEEPNAEKPNAENPEQLNTNKSSTNKSSIKEKKERKKTSFDDILAAYTTDEKTLELLGEWLKVRKAKRAAMTDRAIQLNIDKLDRLANESGVTVKQYLEEVICRGWGSFFLLNNRQGNAPKPEKATSNFEIKGGLNL